MQRCKLMQQGCALLADADNEEGVTPLHCATLAGSLQCARLLIDRGAGKAPRDKAGR